MNKSADMRVPLSEILGVPIFLYGRDREQWIKDNKIDIQDDWAGRESVDLATAWRLKERHDVLLAAAQKDQQRHLQQNAAVTEAQRRREDRSAEAYARISRTEAAAGSPLVAWSLAQAEIEASEKDDLPREVRQKLYWSTKIPLTFANT